MSFTHSEHDPLGIRQVDCCDNSTRTTRTIIIIIIIMIRFVAHTYPPCWVLKARIQKHRGKPLLFQDKCPGFFYVHYTTHGTYTCTALRPIRRTKQLWLSVLLMRQFDHFDKWNSCDNLTWTILYQCLEVDHRFSSKNDCSLGLF